MNGIPDRPFRWPLFPMQMNSQRLRYYLVVLTALTQLVTVLMTWPVWQTRIWPVSIPAFFESFWDGLAGVLPGSTFGIMMVLTLIATVLSPRWGSRSHLLVLTVACVADQFRMQPQFLFLAAILCLLPLRSGPYVIRWILVTLWLWAGLHKAFSPEWFGYRSHALLILLPDWDNDWHLPLAWVVCVSEIALGLLAACRPRWAAVPGFLMHLSIAIFLTPLGIDFNYSVIPWNLLTSLLSLSLVIWDRNELTLPTKLRQIRWVPGVLLTYPALFYIGLDHGICLVLYSGMLPRANITINLPQPDQYPDHGDFRGWKDLNVPFPDEHRTLKSYFRRSAPVGSKMHLFDPRWPNRQLYFLRTADGLENIDRERFLESNPIGNLVEDRQKIMMLLDRDHQLFSRVENGNVYAIRMNPQQFSLEDLELLVALPNLEQLQLANCPVTDSDLQRLPTLRRLTGMGLSHTKITDFAIPQLKTLPILQMVELDGTDTDFKTWRAAGIEVYP